MITTGLAIVGVVALAHRVKRWWFSNEDKPTRDERDPSDQDSHEDK